MVLRAIDDRLGQLGPVLDAVHDACAPIAERWFTGSMTFGPTPFLHPTPLGSAAMARLVLDAIGR